MKKKAEYTDELPKRMYTYFIGYADPSGAPSFDKFARSIGMTLAELEGFKCIDEFMRAWRECSEIRRDYLIDTALTKRFDSSLVKYLLTAEFGMGEEVSEEGGALKVLLEVADS